MNGDGSIKVLIASALEQDHVDRIAAVDPRLNVLFAPELLPTPRYQADHHGPPRKLTSTQLAQWQTMLSTAQISFDFDWYAPAEMAGNCPDLHWVQATSSGIGQFVESTKLNQSNIIFTTAAGVHAVPLAEFALTGVLYFVKQLPALAERQAARHWERYTAQQLAGRRVLVVGLGQIGRKVADVFSAMGVEVWAAVRAPKADVASVTRVFNVDAIDEALPSVDAIVLCCPLTPQTEGLLDGHRLRLLPPGAIVVNIARGPVIDEPALITALADGHIGGACLDVAAIEPLPQESPLWKMPNVIISPHSASTVDSENAALTDLFCDNLQRWLDGQPLRNVYVKEKGY